VAEDDRLLEDVGVAAPKRAPRAPRPKLDESVLCSDNGVPALYDLAKALAASGAEKSGALDKAAENPDSARIVRKRGVDANAVADKARVREQDLLDDTPGHELRSLRHVMGQYRSWANEAFPAISFDNFLERAEKLGGNRQMRDMMDLMRYRVQGGHDANGGGGGSMDDSDDDIQVTGGFDDDEFSLGRSSSSSSSSSSTSSSSSALSKLTDEELKARIARNRAAALERLAKRKAERQAEMQRALEDEEDDDIFASMDLDAIVQQKRQEQQQQESEASEWRSRRRKSRRA
jgi:hypothetical protein